PTLAVFFRCTKADHLTTQSQSPIRARAQDWTRCVAPRARRISTKLFQNVIAFQGLFSTFAHPLIRGKAGFLIVVWPYINDFHAALASRTQRLFDVTITKTATDHNA